MSGWIARHPLESGIPPAWASGWGMDEYGVWGSFSVGEVEQRMRWVPPGTFQMGSPGDEPGRNDGRETPQHWVTLTRGFWLFDTPCTQALYEAVMGTNPSRFKGGGAEFPTDRHPVERVSWEDAQAFCVAVNERVPGLSFGLPTEAQWEFACRAWTTEATYAGAMKILGDNHAPVLDAIAWYGGNSGVEKGFPEAMVPKGWEDKQYPHEQVATHPVGEKEPNALGLYDMLGNVLEWCADGYGLYGEARVEDPIGAEEGPTRVVRGGAWDGDARDVRSAFRGEDWATVPLFVLGFRCLLVPPPAGE